MKKDWLRRALFIALAFILVAMILLPTAFATGSTAGTISFTAKDDAGNAVSSVIFELRNSSTSALVNSAASDSAGLVTFSGVAAGSYAVSASSAPVGYYVSSSAKVTITVLSDGTLQYAQDANQVDITPDSTVFVLRNSEKTFPILDVNGNIVVGAVFNVTSSDGKYIKNFTTTDAGLVLNLPEGTYTLTNVQTPSGWAMSSKSCTVKVDASGNYTFSSGGDPTSVFRLSPGANTLTFTKRDDGGNPVSGAVFHIAGTGMNTTATSNASGIVTFSGLMPGGDYVLTERSAPSGYTIVSKTLDFTVGSDGASSVDNATIEAAFINTRAKWDMTFTLRDDSGAPLTGAKFKLEGGGSTFEAESELGTGRVYFKNIPFGVYTLTQTTPATGYPAVSSKVTVTIYPDGSIAYGNGEDPAEIFLGERARYAFSFTAREETGGTLEGATFILSDGKTNTTQKSRTGGKVGFSDLLPGKYTLKQTATPAGYSPSANTVEVTVAQDGTVKFDYPPEEELVALVAKFTVSFDKMDDTGAPVAGAVFRLVGTNYQRDITSSKSGKVSFPGLLAGTYTLTEQTAPAGYARSAASVTVTVSFTGLTTYSREPAVAFTNARAQYGLEFVTVDENGDPVRDAVFILDNGSERKEATSNRKGRVFYTKLPHGTYTITQKSAPKGYTRSPLTVLATIDPSGKVSGEILEGEDLPNTAVTDLDGVFVNMSGPISFSFEALTDDLLPLRGASFTLMNTGSGKTDMAVSNAAGVAAFYGVQPGSYRLRQANAPLYMVPSEDEYDVEIGSNGEITVTSSAADAQAPVYQGVLPEGETRLIPALSFVNPYERRILSVYCEDAITGAPVPGAVFTIARLPESESPDTTMLLTGEDGIGSIELKPGAYVVKPFSMPTGYELNEEDEPVRVAVPAESDPELTRVQAQPVVTTASVAPQGLIDRLLGFAGDNTVGLIAGGVGVVMLAAFLTILLKK